jgi:hypothetical protein
MSNNGQAIPPTTFTPDVVRGAIGAGALATDTAPTSAEPDASLTARLSPKNAGIFYGSGRLNLIAVNGTSIVVQPWWWDDTNAVWTKLGATTTVTVGTTNFAVITVGGMVGAKFFVQITTNTGVEKFCWFFS